MSKQFQTSNKPSYQTSSRAGEVAPSNASQNTALVSNIISGATPLTANGVLALQQTVGNRATQRLIQREMANRQATKTVQRVQTNAVTVPPLGIMAATLKQKHGEPSNKSNTYKGIISGLEEYEGLIGGNETERAVKILQSIRDNGITWLKHHTGSPDQEVNQLQNSLETLLYREVIKAETILTGQYNNLTADSGNVKGGNVNEVKKFKDNQSNTFFFKSNEANEDKAVDSGNNPIDHAEAAGISIGDDGRPAYLANRAVATYALDELFKTGLVPKTAFAVLNGKFGTVQQKAEGKAPRSTVELDPNNKSSATSPNFYENMILNEAALNRELSTLQVFDGITGQTDRHPGNYFIDRQANGSLKIQAIDNDLAFGKDNDDPNKAVGRGLLGQYKGLPVYVDKGAAKKFMSVSSSQIQEVLKPLLPPAEVENLVSRWKTVCDKLKQMRSNKQLLEEAEWYDHEVASAHTATAEEFGKQVPQNYYGILKLAQFEAKESGRVLTSSEDTNKEIELSLQFIYKCNKKTPWTDFIVGILEPGISELIGKVNAMKNNEQVKEAQENLLEYKIRKLLKVKGVLSSSQAKELDGYLNQGKEFNKSWEQKQFVVDGRQRVQEALQPANA